MSQDSAPGRVRAHLETLVARGRPGDRLPSVRELMSQLGVSPTTVRAAVAELIRSGTVETVPGRGTFVAAPSRRRARSGDRAWQTLALGSTITGEDLLAPLRATPTPDTIDLAGGYPHPGLYPDSLITRALRRAVRRPGVLGRAPVEGIAPLREWFAEQLGPDGGHRVLITPGGQAALSLIFRSLALTGDTVLMESPTYVGAVGAARAAGLVPVPVPMDDRGVLVEGLAAAVDRTGGRILYIQPRFHNPTGATLAPERRPAVMDLARRHGLIVVEDDWLHDLDDPWHRQEPLAADDPDGHVVHVRSLTKSISPAVRIAAVSAAGAIFERIRATRSVEDFFVSPIMQETALDVVTDPAWPRHLERLRSRLAERQELLRDGLEAIGVDPRSVTGGPLHLWMASPRGLDPDELRVAALRNGVSVVSGTSWYPGDVPCGNIRLSNAAGPGAEITVGLERLGRAVDQLSA